MMMAMSDRMTRHPLKRINVESKLRHSWGPGGAILNCQSPRSKGSLGVLYQLNRIPHAQKQVLCAKSRGAQGRPIEMGGILRLITFHSNSIKHFIKKPSQAGKQEWHRHVCAVPGVCEKRCRQVHWVQTPQQLHRR